MRTLIIFIVFYFKVFFIHLILEFISIYWQYIQTLLELFFNLYTKFQPSHIAVQWDPAPTRVARASRNGMGEKCSLTYRAVCLLFSAHTNFWTPPQDEICDLLKLERYHHDRQNIIFLPIPISNPKTVAKRGKTSCIKFLIYCSRWSWSQWLIEARAY